MGKSRHSKYVTVFQLRSVFQRSVDDTSVISGNSFNPIFLPKRSSTDNPPLTVVNPTLDVLVQRQTILI